MRLPKIIIKKCKVCGKWFFEIKKHDAIVTGMCSMECKKKFIKSVRDSMMKKHNDLLCLQDENKEKGGAK